MNEQYQSEDRNLALEAVRVTEAAALASARWMGRGDEKAADQAAVDAMRSALNVLEIQGRVVIGEGERDEAPMLYIGEEVGAGNGPRVDIALDPLEGTTITAKGGPNAIACLAMAPEGGFLNAPDTYMEKIAVGGGLPEGVIQLADEPAQNLRRLAEVKDVAVSDLVVLILDRPRHQDLIAKVRAAGARIRFISDGDVAGAIAAARRGTGVDLLMGIGGTAEGIIAACALKCLGGAIQGRLAPRDEAERERTAGAGYDADRVLATDDLVSGDDVFFAATGITDGDLLGGVRYRGDSAITHSIAMRSRSGTVRLIDAEHHRDKLKRFSAIEY